MKQDVVIIVAVDASRSLWEYGPMKYSKLIFASLIISSGATHAMVCPETVTDDPDSKFYTRYECSGDVVEKAIEYYRPNGNVVGVDLYANGKVAQEDSWSVDGNHTYRAFFEYLPDSRFIKTVYSPQSNMKLRSKEQFHGVDDEDYEKVLEKEWKYSRSGALNAIHYFDREDIDNFITRPVRIDVANKDGEITRYFELEYFDNQMTDKHVRKVVSYDIAGKKVGEFIEDVELDIPAIIKKYNSSEAAAEKLAIYQNTKREPIVVIDTGFDILHPSLTHKLWNNPLDPMDGIDNDGNGYVDDTFGWHYQDDPGLGLVINRNNINETLFVTHFPYPVSHGTHVSSIAMNGIDNFGLVGFGGDVANVDLLKHSSSFIKQHSVRFVNMSFSISYPEHPQAPSRDSFFFLKRIFEENPESLFVVAAGNSRPGVNLDLPDVEDYPASHTFENILLVGAANTDKIVESEMMKYDKAVFSKYGKKSVDLFAPGALVNGAEVAGGSIRLNGTSMASPFAMNIVMKVANANPSLNTKQIKELLLKTVVIRSLEKPLPCVSGGVIFPKRALRVANLLKRLPTLSVEEAVLMVRAGETTQTGEPSNREYLEALKKFWHGRGI